MAAFIGKQILKTKKSPLPLLINVVTAGQGADGYIANKVLEDGVPVSRRVMCYHRKSGILVNSTWSDSNGDYRIDSLIAGVTYYLTALDENGDEEQYNAVTQDLIVASRL